MKKKGVIYLAIIFSLSVASTAFGAETSFSDVPKDHWSYKAVDQLVKDGLVSGYDDKTFRGDTVISRYEMAVIVAKAMENIDKADSQTKTLVNKMSTEYSKELQAMGVRVTRLERAVAQAEPSLIDWSGTNLSFQTNNMTKVINGKAYSQSIINGRDKYQDLHFYTTELVMSSRVSENWRLEVKAEGSKNFEGNNVIQNHLTGLLDLKSYKVSGKVWGGTLTLGRAEDNIINGLVYDDFMSGARFEFGKKDTGLKTTVYVGKVDNSNTSYGTLQVIPTYINQYFGVNLTALKVDYTLNDRTDLHAAAYRTEAYNDAYQMASIWEAAFNTKLNQKLELKGDYAKSNFDDNNTSYMVGLNYKTVDRSVPRSNGWVLDYVKIGAKAVIETGYDFKNYQYTSATNMGDVSWNTTTKVTTLNSTNGQKGWQFTYRYVPIKNVLLTVRYLRAEPVNGNDYDVIKWFRAQLAFFF
ncbi:S-layer homology domain-containing protein [Pelosinus propionicus]|uniref:S-layer homology domain-containing protein n=1 Tax=Pelosinus propionicus DSM 13327 TaxID=1123291 RepID=A0A1I4JVH2_9FIRM|nr:S-layer homology domain-containing protein [Pelosinus propionicus]SFL70578.1 S-layer homology domain-containing protein [Pelosinus propionicus DSM 13327]